VFEDDIVAALTNREIEAAAVTRMTVGSMLTSRCA